MRYLLIIVLCLSTLLLCGCGLLTIYIAAPRAHYTKCIVKDSETNRLEVMQVVRSIADRYGFQDRTEEQRARLEREYGVKGSGTRLAYYYAAGRDKPSSDISLSIDVTGDLETSLLQVKWGKVTKKYTEIQDRLVSEFKERFGANVEVKIYVEL